MKHSIIILLISLFLSFVAVAQEEYSTPQLPDSLVERLKENRGTDLNRAMALDDVIMFILTTTELLMPQALSMNWEMLPTAYTTIIG